MQERPQLFPNIGKAYKVEWVQLMGSPLTISAAAADQIDFGEASWPPIIKAQLKGIPIITVADGLQSIKGKSFSPMWTVLEESGIKMIQDLKGKMISVVSYGSDYDVYLRMYLKKNGLDPAKDVKIIEVGAPFAVTALRSKKVDMVPLTTPEYFIQKDKGGVLAIFNNNDVIPEIQVIQVFARKAYLKSGGETLKAFMSDYAKAAKYCFDNPLESTQIMIKSKGLDLSYAAKVQDFTRDPNAFPNVRAMQVVMDVLYDTGVINKKLAPEELADTRFLPKR